MRITIGCILLLLIIPIVQAQEVDQSISEIKNELANATSDTTVVRLLTKLAVRHYKNHDFELAKPFIRRSANLAENVGDAMSRGKANHLAARIFSYLEDPDSTNIYAEAAEHAYIEAKDTTNLIANFCFKATLARNRGEIGESRRILNFAYEFLNKQDTLTEAWYLYHWNLGSLESNQRNSIKSISHFYSASKIMLLLGDSSHLDAIYHNIGNNYDLIGDYKKAISLFRKSVKWNIYSGRETWQINHYHALAQVYQTLLKYDSTSYYIQQAAVLSKKINSKAHLIDNLYRKALLFVTVYQDSTFTEKANAERPILKQDKEHLLDSSCVAFSALYDKTKDSPMFIAQFSASCLGLAEVYRELGQYDHAFRFMEEYENLVTMGKISDISHESDHSFSELYADLAIDLNQKGETRKAYEYLSISIKRLKNYRKNRDSLNLVHQSIDVTRQEKNYLMAAEEHGFEVNQHLIEATLRQEEQRYRWIMIAAGVIILIVLITAKFMQGRIKLIRRQNIIITAQKERLDARNNKITDSINYANRIQESILPKDLKACFPLSVLLFKPKDIVSGDFYWSYESTDFTMLCVADCTGHGVPGAFMSMLGSTMLDRIVSRLNISEPGDVLNNLSIEINHKLGGKGEEMTDGMDLVLMKFDNQFHSVEFASAKNKLVHIRNESYTIYKGQPLSIGNLRTTPEYITTRLALRPGDHIYTFTDGFQDQIGGPNNKRYQSTAFYKMLIAQTIAPASQRQQLIESEFNTWIGSKEQSDDVCLFGMEIT